MLNQKVVCTTVTPHLCRCELGQCEKPLIVDRSAVTVLVDWTYYDWGPFLNLIYVFNLLLYIGKIGCAHPGNRLSL